MNTSQTCELAIINGEIVAYCKTNDFTQAVRRAVNDEMFWRDLLQRSNISMLVQNEMNNKLPSSVSQEVRNIVPRMVQDQLDNYTRIQIPNQVAKNLSDQISVYLNNNQQMQQILHNHSDKLNTELDSSARDILNQVTNEEKYQTVTNSHIDNMNNRFTINTNTQLAQQQGEFNSNLQMMKNQVNNEIKNFIDTNNKVKDQEITINNLKHDIGHLQNAIGGLFIFISVITIGVLLMK